MNRSYLDSMNYQSELHFEFLNRKIVALTQVQVHRWGPRRIRIPALFLRQTYITVV